jgi:hypothetical protein
MSTVPKMHKAKDQWADMLKSRPPLDVSVFPSPLSSVCLSVARNRLLENGFMIDFVSLTFYVFVFLRLALGRTQVFPPTFQRHRYRSRNCCYVGYWLWKHGFWIRMATEETGLLEVNYNVAGAMIYSVSLPQGICK